MCLGSKPCGLGAKPIIIKNAHRFSDNFTESGKKIFQILNGYCFKLKLLEMVVCPSGCNKVAKESAVILVWRILA